MTMDEMSVEDTGGGMIRPVKNPTYTAVLALPDGADFVLVANIKGETAERNHIEPGQYISGHTMSPKLRQNWMDALGEHNPDDYRAADIMFYVLPPSFTEEIVTASDSVLSAEEIAADALKKFRSAIINAAADTENPFGALAVFGEIIEDTVKQARKGYVRPPF